jgi:hypothetical protein
MGTEFAGSALPAFSKRARQDCGPSPCYMNRCADVELQLILQLLSNQERLAAAKVSRRMLHAVSQPFSWHHAPVVELEFDVRLQRSLIRIAPISLLLDNNELVTAAQVAAIPNLYAINIGVDANVLPEFDEEILAHPAARSLQSFTFPVDFNFAPSPSALQRLAQLPRLTFVCINISSVPANFLKPLAASQNLTHLDLWCSSLTQIAPLIHFSQLRKLSLTIPFSFAPGDWTRAFTGSLAASLEELTMMQRYGDRPVALSTVPASEYATVFTDMKRLRILELVDFNGVNVLLRELHHAPALRHLCVTFCDITVQKPEVAVLRSLAQVPLLRCKLMLVGNHSMMYIISLMKVPDLTLGFVADEDEAEQVQFQTSMLVTSHLNLQQ